MNPWGVTVPPPTEAEFFNAARPTAFLLVEGGSDERFWLARVDRRSCQVRAAGSRDKALTELHTVRVEGRGGFVAVLDADFDRLEGTLPEEPDVVWTDLHDLELMLIASPALDKVVVEACSRPKCEKLEAEEGCGVREALLSRGLEPARLRWLSRRDSLALTFRKRSPDGSFRYLDYAAFCDRVKWRLDLAVLVKTVLDFSSQHRIKPQDLVLRMKSLPEADAWQLCVGHDLVGLLSVGLRSKLGNRSISIEDLQERLRLAFERGHLEATGMFAALRRWERANAPFRVLPS